MLNSPGKHNSFYQGMYRKNQLADHLIYVFGSNEAGIHGRGAAKEAHRYYGAILGKGRGLVGRSYAIPTKDFKIKTLPLWVITGAIEEFILFSQTSGHEFYVTPVGTGLAGYLHRDIAPLFRDVENAWLPIEWEPYLKD